MVYRKGGQSSSEKTEAEPKPDVGAKENLNPDDLGDLDLGLNQEKPKREYR